MGPYCGKTVGLNGELSECAVGILCCVGFVYPPSDLLAKNPFHSTYTVYACTMLLKLILICFRFRHVQEGIDQMGAAFVYHVTKL